MRAYTGNGPSASGTANKTALTIVGASTVRPRLYEFMASLLTAPNSTDQQFNYALQRFTAAGTSAGSAPTPSPVDPGDVAALASLGWTHSAEPTYSAAGLLIDTWVNQRGKDRWVANPGQELLSPATSANGLGLFLKGIASAAQMAANMAWYE